jgi:transglutaminase-like putative cysteine protease
MTILTVRHVTTYRYRRLVAFGEHRMMFRPGDSYDQRLIDSRLLITPEPASLRWIHDLFGNCVALAWFNTRASELRFESTIRVKHYPWNVPDLQTEPQAKTYPFAYDPDEIQDLMPSIARSYPDPNGEIDRWVRKFLRAGRPTPTGRLLMTLTCAIKESFTYTRRTERGTQEPVATLRFGRGSCRDFALLMMEAVRSLGLAARFVPAICMFHRVMAPNMSAAARPTRGAKSICRAPAGSNSIRQMASSEIVTSSASLLRVIRGKRSRSPAPIRENSRMSWT